VLVGFGLANVMNDLGVPVGNATGMIGLDATSTGSRALLGLVRGQLLAHSSEPHTYYSRPLRCSWVALLLLASLATLAQPALDPHDFGIARKTGCLAPGDRPGCDIRWRPVSALLFVATPALFLDATPHRLNTVKTLLQLPANGVAGITLARG
jgi:hypothetical protein